MAELLKNLYNEAMLAELSLEISKHYPSFDAENFAKQVFYKGWQSKELKQRMRHIAESLQQFIPLSYSKTIAILKQASSQFSGFEYMFFQDFVEVFGMDDYQISVNALEHFTKYSSSEFAVRPLIKKHPQKMMVQMELWAQSKNHHVRRLASEGCRPRLPWAMALPQFKKDPTPILTILEKLKNDKSEYVRRSVANNLNDIAKDNPKTVIEIAHNWLGKTENTDKLIKHACRTLLKNAEPKILLLFGFAEPNKIKVTNFMVQKKVNMGQMINFSFKVWSQQQLGKLRIEYGIDFVKNNGKLARKIFKISESNNLTKEKTINKKYSFKKISTRVYYPGKHGLAIIINGVEKAYKNFELK